MTGRRAQAPRRAARWAAVLAACAAMLVAAACRPPSDEAPEVRVDVETTPTPAAVGPARVRLVLSDTVAGRPVRGAAVRVEGTMTHPGMAPSAADAAETAPGVYAADLDLTMAGDWVLLVDARLADGRTLRRQMPLRGVRPTPGAAVITD